MVDVLIIVRIVIITAYMIEHGRNAEQHGWLNIPGVLSVCYEVSMWQPCMQIT